MVVRTIKSLRQNEVTRVLIIVHVGFFVNIFSEAKFGIGPRFPICVFYQFVRDLFCCYFLFELTQAH